MMAKVKMNRLELEERIAHLINTVDELSDVVAAQAKEIDRLIRITAILTQKESEREQMIAYGIAPADQKPPHW